MKEIKISKTKPVKNAIEQNQTTKARQTETMFLSPSPQKRNQIREREKKTKETRRRER